MVLVSGLTFALLGLAVILLAALPGWPGWLGAVIWLAFSVIGGLRLSRRYRRVVSYRLYADGSVEFSNRDGSRSVGRLAPGTVLLPRLAWLRLRGPNRAIWGELVAGDSRTDEQWRRFQVICRHVAAC